MDISSIHFHDTPIRRVAEDCAVGTLTMDVDYPVDWDRGVFERRQLVFDGAHNYQVFEGPFRGLPTIVDAEIVATEEQWSRVRLQTNAGYREVSCTGLWLRSHDEAG